jgi:hypothetical protein
MTPTPVTEVATPSMTGFWLIVGFIGVVALLLIIGLITGEVSLKPYKLRRAGIRGAMTFDGIYSGKDKRAAIEYILDEEHLVVLDQERGEGDDDDTPD